MSPELPLVVVRGRGHGAGVVVMPSAFGVTDDLRSQLEELATDASLVATFDPFFRTDPGVVPYDAFQRVMQRVRAFDHAQGLADFCSAMAWVERESGHAAVTLGICFGGPIALLAAERAHGAAAWHGTRLDDIVPHASALRCPMRLEFGSVDPFVPPATVEALRTAFAGRADVKLAVHEGATHGFTHRGAAQAYHPSAERAAMASVRELVTR